MSNVEYQVSIEDMLDEIGEYASTPERRRLLNKAIIKLYEGEGPDRDILDRMASRLKVGVPHAV